MRPVLVAIGVLALLAPALLPQKSETDRAAVPATAGDSRVAKEVRHELVMLPYYGVFDNLEFKVEGGVVTLSGEVREPVLRRDAENAVKRIEGVTKIDNQIKVLPNSPMDDQLRRAAYRAIYNDPSLSRYAFEAVPPIHIIVENGHLTLVGVVATGADKTLAGIRAKTLPGVFSVDNQLQTEGK